MFKMLIVEDERWEREGLAEFLDWESLGIELPGIACDGIEGLEKAKEIKPDIIITDIKMPGLDGLKMSKQIKEFLPEVKIIILTGYDHFNLAKEAIGISVNAYILKPVETEELLDIMNKITAECRNNLEKKKEAFKLKSLLGESTKKSENLMLIDLLKGKISLEGKHPLHNIFDGCRNFKVAAVKLHRINSPDNKIEISDVGNLIDALLKDIKIEGIKLKTVFDENEETVYIIICFTEASVLDINKAEELMTDRFIRNRNSSTIIGTGKTVNNPDALQLSWKQAVEALNHGVFIGDPSVTKYEDLEIVKNRKGNNLGEFITQSSYYKKQLQHSVREALEERTFSLLDEMFETLNANAFLGREVIANYLYGVSNEILLIIYNKSNSINNEAELDKTANIKLLSIHTLPEMKEYFYGLVEGILERIRDKKSNKDENIVKKVKQIIDERYNSDISLKTIASDIYLSPNYLGSIFKRNTGVAFNDYLCHYRMEVAKELLKSPKNRVSWVAQEVGISNTSYFCMLFKNEYGVAPGEYQEYIIRGF